jgi:tRNA(Ile)-lysidine synthase
MGAHGSTLEPSQRAAAVGRLRRAVAVAIDRRRVLTPGETVVVACSGGPDSTAMLDALARLAPPRGLRLHVAHVDHGLRQGSAAEAKTVATAAAERGLAFTALTVGLATGGSSLQDRARNARHAALRDLADSTGASAIAIGHTADDQAETVLMRALAGATPRALAAMADRTGPLCRPLLGVWRIEVLAYCTALSLVTVEDPSNSDPRFLRSRVRHELIPALERVFPAAKRRLCAVADGQRRLLDHGAAEWRLGRHTDAVEDSVTSD